MATTVASTKSDSKKSNNSPAATSDKNDTPITEEELKKKESAITVNDVLRLKKSTQGRSSFVIDDSQWDVVLFLLGYLTDTDENAYKIDFIHFRIRDMKTNRVLFEVRREQGMNEWTCLSLSDWIWFDELDDDDDVIDQTDPAAGRFVQYRFPQAFLKLKQVGAL